MVKNIGNGITHLSHGFLQRAGGLGGIGTVRTFLVGRLADTADRRQRPVQNADDLAEGDFFRGLDEGIPASNTTATGQQAGAFQCKQDLFEKLHRDILTLSAISWRWITRPP